METWTVTRHSGRDNTEPRVVGVYRDPRAARAAYDEIRIALRQGQVTLIGPDGEAHASAWAPRLRTRW